MAKTWKVLGAEDIDGAVNLVDTPCVVYTVGTNTQTLTGRGAILNRGVAAAAVRVWVCASGKTSTDVEYALVWDGSVAADGWPVEISPGYGMESGATMYFQSDTVDVNFFITGQEEA